MSHNKDALQLYLVTKLFKQRQQHVIDDQKAVLRVVHNESQLVCVQAEIERMHHASGGRHAEVRFQMRVVVPAERGHAISGLQAGAVERLRQRLGAAIKIQVGVTMQAAIGQAGDDFHRGVNFWDALQDCLQGKRVIHHGSLHAHASPGVADHWSRKKRAYTSTRIPAPFLRRWLILLPAMKLTRTLCLLLMSAFCSASMLAQNSFTVGTATAGPGQKVTGTLEVPAGVDAATSIPVVVVRGAKTGPVLALVSGAHGTEYASIIALEKVIQSLDPAQVSGTVIILPLVNIASFEQKVPHVNPVDGKSMNRFYPGKQDGTQTERVSYVITKQVVERCDYLVDYHGGDLDENLRPYAYWPKSGDARHDAITRNMALAFGLDHIIVWSDRPKDPAASRYLDNTANTRGKPAIAVEAGYSGTVQTGRRGFAGKRHAEPDALFKNAAGRAHGGGASGVVGKG